MIIPQTESLPAEPSRGRPFRQLSTGDLALLMLAAIMVGFVAGCLTRSSDAPVEAAWLAGISATMLSGTFLLSIRDRMIR
ncbi:hypothetical protein [Paractinoplanes toevensis]|nr:hypothetical protein [Actinoplanes toevensis]